MDKYNLLYTPQGEAISEESWLVYPRPQMVRDSFYSLNGWWEFGCGENKAYTEKIRVPFAPESRLSLVGRAHMKGDKLFYRKRFSLPEGFVKKRVLLNIGACDQVCRVSLNGHEIGSHEGGYHPFAFDVTDALLEENELEICAADELEKHEFPYGKQTDKRGGMWYTCVSGVWQTVWLESVPEKYIRKISVETGRDYALICVEGDTGEGEVSVSGQTERVFPLKDGKARIEIPDPVLWSPENPHLYDFTVTCGEDEVKSYFALRTLEVKDIGGIKRMCLNGKPYFFHGVLDQGYYSDGLFTPAAPENYENDIRYLKSLGFNTIRKHIKAEPEWFYYLCDKMGMCVWQDMINNADYHFLRDTLLPTIGFKKRNDKRMHGNEINRKRFIECMEETVLRLKNHPSVVYWTIFNEGWGQFDSQRMYEKMKKLDASRFIATVSGWFKGADTDVSAEHVYFKPVRIKAGHKPVVVSEFGGYAYQVKGHVFNSGKEYGYKKFKKREELVRGIVSLYEREIVPAISKGLCGAIYTQLSDVEDETNGLLTYDRRIVKVQPEEFWPVSQAINEEVQKIQKGQD
ncbi:MAG: glycoside hydrolase family 2 [Clostridia bacterium]|nr:glycoside hydrolase family 2 [Clostridia bacterium]